MRSIKGSFSALHIDTHIFTPTHPPVKTSDFNLLIINWLKLVQRSKQKCREKKWWSNSIFNGLNSQYTHSICGFLFRLKWDDSISQWKERSKKEKKNNRNISIIHAMDFSIVNKYYIVWMKTFAWIMRA